MENTKIEQIKNNICDHMLGIDLDKLSLYELTAYINAFKALEGINPFPGFSFGSLGCATTASNSSI